MSDTQRTEKPRIYSGSITAEKLKYTLGKGTIRTLAILESNPGINASNFAVLRWPRIKSKNNPGYTARLAAIHLRKLKNEGLVTIRYSANPFKEKAHCVYYLSEHGFEVNEYYNLLARQPAQDKDGAC